VSRRRPDENDCFASGIAEVQAFGRRALTFSTAALIVSSASMNCVEPKEIVVGVIGGDAEANECLFAGRGKGCVRRRFSGWRFPCRLFS